MRWTMSYLHRFPTIMTMLCGSLLSKLLLDAEAFLSSCHTSSARRTGTAYSYGSHGYPLYFQAKSKSEDVSPQPTYMMHDVDDITCREVSIDVDTVGPVTILEATAESQEVLVDAALALDDEEEVVGGPPHLQLDVGDPYGSVLWPAASAVANHLMKSNNEDRNRHTLLELGTGTGLVAISAAIAGYKTVIATDYESVPLRLLEYSAAKLNGEDTDLTSRITTSKLDICDFGVPLPDADIVVAADIMYEPKTGRATAHRAVEALRRGSRVVIGCSPGRPGRPAFLEELRELIPGIEAKFDDAEGTTCSGPRHELICGKDSASISEKPKMLLVALMDLSPDCVPAASST